MNHPSNHPSTRKDDSAAGLDITPELKRFAQRNDVFTRAFWNDTLRSYQTDDFFASYRLVRAPFVTFASNARISRLSRASANGRKGWGLRIFAQRLFDQAPLLYVPTVPSSTAP